MRHQLFIITPSGCYPALSSTSPTDQVKDLERLEEVVHALRPGLGKYYLTSIVRCDEQGTVLEEDSNFLRKESDILASNCL